MIPNRERCAVFLQGLTVYYVPVLLREVKLTSKIVVYIKGIV